MQNHDNSSVQNNSCLKSGGFLLLFVLFCFFPWQMRGHRCICSWCLFKTYVCSSFLHETTKQKVLQKQRKENGVSTLLFYNNSSASCLHWFISRNTPHLFLVPHPFKIEVSVQNSLSLQCTYLCFFMTFLGLRTSFKVHRVHKLSAYNNAAWEVDYRVTDFDKACEHWRHH